MFLPVADREFIESRRRALKRFINLVARHPPFSEDVLLKLFLSFSGSVSTFNNSPEFAYLPVTALLGAELRIAFHLHVVAPCDEENFLSADISIAGKWEVI